MKVTQMMPPVHAANLVANSGNTAYGVDALYIFLINSNWICKLFLVMKLDISPSDLNKKFH